MSDLCYKCGRGDHHADDCRDSEWMAGFKPSQNYGNGLLNNTTSQYSIRSQSPKETSLRGRSRAPRSPPPYSNNSILNQGVQKAKAKEPCWNCWETNSHDESTCDKPRNSTVTREGLRVHYRLPVSKGWHLKLKEKGMLPPRDEIIRREEEAEHYRKWLKESKGTGIFTKKEDQHHQSMLSSQSQQQTPSEGVPRPRRKTEQDKENEKALEDAIRRLNGVRQRAGQEESRILDAKNRIQVSKDAKEILEQARETVREAKDYIANAQLSYERARELFLKTDNETIFDIDLPPTIDTVLKQTQRAKSFLHQLRDIVMRAYDSEEREKIRVKEMQAIQDARMEEFARQRAKQDAGSRKFLKESYPPWDHERGSNSQHLSSRGSNTKTASILPKEMPAPQTLQSAFGGHRKENSLIDLTEGMSGMGKRGGPTVDSDRTVVPSHSPVRSKQSDNHYTASVRESASARFSINNRPVSEKAISVSSTREAPETISQHRGGRTNGTIEATIITSDSPSPDFVEHLSAIGNSGSNLTEVKNTLAKFTGEMNQMGHDARKFYDSIDRNIRLLVEKVEDRKAYNGQHLTIPAVNFGDDDAAERLFSEMQAVNMLKEAVNDLTQRIDKHEKQPHSPEVLKLVNDVGERVSKCELILKQYNKRNETSLRKVMEQFTDQADHTSDRMTKVEQAVMHQSKKNGDNIDAIKVSLEMENMELTQRVESLEIALEDQERQFSERLAKLEERQSKKRDTADFRTKHKTSRAVSSNELKDTPVITSQDEQVPSTPPSRMKFVPAGSSSIYHPGTSATHDNSDNRAGIGYISHPPIPYQMRNENLPSSPPPVEPVQQASERGGSPTPTAEPDPREQNRLLLQLINNMGHGQAGSMLAGIPGLSGLVPQAASSVAGSRHRDSSPIGYSAGHKYSTRSAAHRGRASGGQF